MAPVTPHRTLLYTKDPHSLFKSKKFFTPRPEHRSSDLEDRVSQLTNAALFPLESSKGKDLYPLFRKLFDEAAEYLGDAHARLDLIVRTLNMPISISPNDITPNKPLIELALRTSHSRIPLHEMGKSYKIFQSFIKYLNNRTKATWENEPPKALQSLEPSWSFTRKDCNSIGKFISEIKTLGSARKFNEARKVYTVRNPRIGFSAGLKAAEKPILGLRTVYTTAVTEGFVDSKTFGTYLRTLIAKLKQVRDDSLKEKIRREATIVYITACRLNLGNEIIDTLFNKLF
jgi:hypothetical protein